MTTDPQSGLLTHESFDEMLASHISSGDERPAAQAVLSLSINEHRLLRDNLGEARWVEAVAILGKIITTVLGPEERASRYEENQFVIWLPETIPVRVEGLIGHIQAAVAQQNDVGSLPIKLSLMITRAFGSDRSGAGPITLADPAARSADRSPSPAQSSADTVLASPRALALSSLAHGKLSDVVAAGATILIVDDEPAVLALVRDVLDDTGASLITAERAEQAVVYLREGRVDVLVADINLPGLSGIELLSQARTLDPTVVVIMMTGSRELDLAVEAIRTGADDYVVKPFSAGHLIESVSRGLMKRQLILGGKAYQELLESQVDQRSRQLQQVVRQLEQTYRETLQALGAALDTRDIATHAHSERVAQYALTLGRALQMNDTDLTILERGVYLHDIGKIGIPDRILLNRNRLTPQEWDVMKSHCELGYRLASQVEFLRDASKIILAHHEKFDGTGYPYGLSGRAIPFGARLFAVVDALDAITSDRPYRKARTFEHARDEISRSSGRQFDPVLVEAFDGIPLHVWSHIRESVHRRSEEAQGGSGSASRLLPPFERSSS